MTTIEFAGYRFRINQYPQGYGRNGWILDMKFESYQQFRDFPWHRVPSGPFDVDGVRSVIIVYFPSKCFQTEDLDELRSKAQELIREEEKDRETVQRETSSGIMPASIEAKNDTPYQSSHPFSGLARNLATKPGKCRFRLKLLRVIKDVSDDTKISFDHQLALAKSA